MDSLSNEILPPRRKFSDPHWTADGQRRASVRLRALDTLWFNTGTLCNLECRGCYIGSSPRNDRLVYLSLAEVEVFLDEIATLGLATREIGLTGGEPFMNPELIEIVDLCLGRGFEVLLLTNAMRPMEKVAPRLRRLLDRHGPERLTIRVSIDHYTRAVHERERGPRSWAPMIKGLEWLAENGFPLSVAGRHFTDEPEAALRAGYARLFAAHGLPVDAGDPGRLVLFPEMDATAEVAEITTACWDILGVRLEAMMCATSRMVVKRKGDPAPVVLACTLIADDRRFELGASLAEAAGPVALNHPHCAKFCVLGGGSCSASPGT